MRREIRSLQRSLNITALYVTHDQEEAMSISDRVALMRQGRIVQTGSPEEVYFSPRDDFVADFIGGAFPLEVDGERLLLRPDQVRICLGGERRGVLKERVFLGASVDWILQWQGQRVRASFPSSDEAAVPIGAEVAFRICRGV
jgi:iron(III) transport system ATP-binding protein